MPDEFRRRRPLEDDPPTTVVDTEIGGVRKLKGGAGDGGRTV
jgi:hypothetical protein